MALPDPQSHHFPFTHTHITKQTRGIDLQSQEANPTDSEPSSLPHLNLIQTFRNKAHAHLDYSFTLNIAAFCKVLLLGV